MKKILSIFILSLSFGVYAQKVEPKFEVEGDKVKATYFHANGEISQTGYFFNEKLDGKWNMFNNNGEKIAMGNYTNGVKTGKWLFWEGDTMKEVNFDDNKIASVANVKKQDGMVIN